MFVATQQFCVKLVSKHRQHERNQPARDTMQLKLARRTQAVLPFRSSFPLLQLRRAAERRF